MDKFKLHDCAVELSSSKSGYKLARELLELQEQYTIYEQKIAGYTSILEDLLKVNKVLMDEVESLKSQQKVDDCAKTPKCQCETQLRVQYELEC